jgi:hypothetical protein
MEGKKLARFLFQVFATSSSFQFDQRGGATKKGGMWLPGGRLFF